MDLRPARQFHCRSPTGVVAKDREPHDVPRQNGVRAVAWSRLRMGVKQRRGASASDGGAKPADSRRARKDAEWRSVKRVAQLFVLILGLVFTVTGVMYARGATRVAELRAEEFRLEAEAARAASSGRTGEGSDMQKGKLMLQRQHAAGLQLVRSIRDDGQLKELEKFWHSLETSDRRAMWDGARDTLLSDPSLGSLLKDEGKRVTDALVPEMYAHRFAEEPERMPRLVRILLDGEEHGGDVIPNSDGGAVGHKEARMLYRSAILSRFVTTFLVHLLDEMATLAGVETDAESR